MKKLSLILLGLLFAHPVLAADSLEPLLNKVTLQMHAEQWVTTKTALVNVGVNAAVAGQGVEKIQNDVLQQLGQLASNADWHIVAFNRQQDKSGLESMQIAAQARLSQADLVNLRDKAKSISKPGETFTIDDVQFTPSEDELRQANIAMRNSIYQQVKAEVDALNKQYPDQKYYLHQLDFIIVSPITPMPVALGRTAMLKTEAQAAPLSIGNKQELQATVVLAAMPDQVVQKLTQH